MSNNGIVRHNELHSFMYLRKHRLVWHSFLSLRLFFFSGLIPGEFECGMPERYACQNKGQLFAYAIKIEIAN